MRNWIAMLILCLPITAKAQEQVNAFVFGNSLINHISEDAGTAVPFWLAQLATAGGHGFALDGTFGFPRDFATRLPPEPGWSFPGVETVWDTENFGFRRAGFDTIILNPENFVQYQAPDAAYADDRESPVSITRRVLDYTDGQIAGARYFIYEGWAELGQYPPDAGAMADYHAYNLGEYHDWYVEYAAALGTAERPVALIPVAQVLSRLLTETPLAALQPTDLYVDDAPHGTASLYFLAALVTYCSLYSEAPPADFVPPDTLHPLIVQTYPQIADFVWAAATGAVQTGDAAPLATSAAPAAPALAMGLNGIADWSTQMPFVDMMKTARPWIGHLPGQWGGFDADLLESGGYLDANGWLLRMPDGVEAVEAMVLTDQPAGASWMTGRYRLTYDGTGQISIGGLAREIEAAPGEIWFSYTPGPGLVGVRISATDPADPLRNIALVKEDMIPLFELGALFNPHWTRTIRDLRLVRFMDWMGTNGSDQMHWSDRPLPGDYTYARRGVPVEVMVSLANEMGTDVWFTMPHMADDAYVAAFAALVHDSLDPRLRVYAEYSNEIWNFIFPQTHWAVEQARARWGDAAGDDAWMQFAGMRAAQVADIWAAAFADAPERLVRVIATHTGWQGLEEPLLQAPLAVAQGSAPPVQSFDAYAITGYFGFELGLPERSETLHGWIAAGDAAAQATDMIRAGSLDELLTEIFPYHATVATAHGLDLVMYEGGSHVVGLEAVAEDDALTEFFTSYNYGPEMAQLYAELLDGWRASGGTLFNAFVDVGTPSKWGSWGAMRHLDDINPRSATLLAYNAAGAAWDARPAESFAQGDLITGTQGDDKIVGTDLADILIGLDGDDHFSVQGADRVHGGAGFDVAILPGVGPDYSLVWEGARMVATGPIGRVVMVGIDGVAFADMPGRLEMPETGPETVTGN